MEVPWRDLFANKLLYLVSDNEQRFSEIFFLSRTKLHFRIESLKGGQLGEILKKESRI